MSIYDIGRVCAKTMGREAARYCVIVDVIDKNYLLIDGLKIKRRRVNFRHIIPTENLVEIAKGASHDEVVEAIKSAKFEKLFNSAVEIPTI